RKMTAAAATMIGLGALATLWIRQPWQLFALWGVVVGVGTGMVAIVLGATIVQRWFYSHRGLALGLLTASAATGQLLFLPPLAQLVVSHGWRSAVLAVSIAALSVGPLAL